MRRFFQTATWLVVDIVLINISIYSAYLIRFKGVIDPAAFTPYLSLWPYIAAAHLIAFSIFKLYIHPNRFSKQQVIINSIFASTIAAMASMSIVYVLRRAYGFMPSSVFAFAWLFNVILIGGWRVFIRYEA